MTSTDSIKAVSDYTRQSFSEVLELDCYDFKLLLGNAITCNMRKTEEGREYLENCYLLTQTNIDRKTLKAKFN